MTCVLSRRELLAGATLALAGVPSLAEARPPVLIELFTSQGCSSCPPADALASELMRRDDLLVVSLNVDYWDYLGWKDTLARPEFTKRQRDYARARGDNDVYTPQMVINGVAHAVGSRKRQVESVLAEVGSARTTVPLDISFKGDEVRVQAKAHAGVDEATLWLMSVAPAVTTAIGRGENAGKTITYHNVVRRLSPFGMYHGAAADFAMPRDAVIAQDATFCIAVLQRNMVGEVLGLAKVAARSS
jgi:hypothetical protein